MDASGKMGKHSARTLFSIHAVVLCLLFCVSRCSACQPANSEITELKFYRSQTVIQATVISRSRPENAKASHVNMSVRARTLKGTVHSDELTVAGFGTEDPCFWDAVDLSDNLEYIVFLGEVGEDGFYPLVGNPVESTDSEKKAIRKFTREGSAPVFERELKDKTFASGDRMTLSCTASGYPTPKLRMTKDNMTLHRSAVRGISYKHGKGGIRFKFKNLQKSTHEGVYACIAENGVHPAVITSGTIEICTLDCANGELNLKECTCGCEEDWDGIQCNIPLLNERHTAYPCNANCGDHGRVDSNRCQCVCDEGYSGETCDVVCNNTCGAHGTLDSATCICQCEAEYYGVACSSEFIGPSSGDGGGGIPAGTADELCLEGSYCENGGTCYIVDDPKTRQLISLCSCPNEFMGKRCECNLDCGLHGQIDTETCTCDCEKDYRGTYCQTDDHTKPCAAKYEHYCSNGGECVLLVGIGEPSCRCPMLYGGKRCERMDTDLDCGCLNGGDCIFNQSKNGYECNCPEKYTGDRCQYKSLPTSQTQNDGEKNFKMVITMSVIFVSMLAVIGIVIIVYVRNRNYREKERREQLEQVIMDQRKGMRFRGSLPSASGTTPGWNSPTDVIQMTSFQDPPPESQKGLRQSNNSLGRGSLPGGGVDGAPRKTSQASVNSNHSLTNKGDVTVRPKNGYSAVPTQEESEPVGDELKTSSDTSLEGKGDPDTLPLTRPGAASSDLGSDSEDTDVEADVIDVPNPQMQALQNHLGSDHDSGDYTWDEHSSPGRRVGPPPYDTSPLHQPRGRGRLNGAAEHVNLHENPLIGKPPSPIQDDSQQQQHRTPSDAYYSERLKDVVENSPPAAV